MSKTKKIIFIICCAILIFVTGFCSGRFIRFRRVSGAGEQLVKGIVLTRDTVDTIADELNISRASINSANDLKRAVSKGLQTVRKGNEVGELLIHEVERSIEDNQKCTENLKQSYSDLSDATGYAIDLAIIRAEEYERLIGAFQQIINDTPENGGK